MQPEQPRTLEYSTPPAPSPAGLGKVVGAFLGGWFLGVILTGILADIITQEARGHPHDGGMYFIAAYAIVLEAPLLAVFRAALGRRMNPLLSFLFGLACGPVILVVMIALV